MPDGTTLDPRLAAAIELSEVLDKPMLLVQSHDLPAAAAQLGPLLCQCGDVFERQGPVRIVPTARNLPKVVRLTEHSIVAAVHRTCQPVKRDANGKEKPITLPRDVARMYLDGGDFGLPVLAGISMAPLVGPDGSIRAAAGYDNESGMWCVEGPALNIPAKPTKQQAFDALQRRRAATATLPYADGPRVVIDGEDRADDAQPPAVAESAYLALQMTAVIRSSLPLAPGFAIMAPSGNGRGSGKGKAVGFVCRSAYGYDPAAATAPPGNPAELEKRVEAEFLTAKPVFFLDNLNDQTFKSNQLQPAITQGRIGIRPLGTSTVPEVSTNTLVVLTGNGLVIGGDLTRRILPIHLDPRCENAELRRFKADFANVAAEARAAFLQDWLTIFRWGCQNRPPHAVGSPFGFPDWERMVRDPLVQLGCRDPVAAAQEAKQLDPEQREAAELFKAWDEHYGDKPVTAHELAGGLLAPLLNPQARPRQYVATKLDRMATSRLAGFVLTVERGGKWSATTYSLRRTDEGSAPPPSRGKQPEPPRIDQPFKYRRRAPELAEQRLAKYDKPGREPQP